ncbi:hypothetical protein [Sphingomonas baiyangensis]|uniref:Uncharacterized protein n=1 Tax=Sphingomonas baiyangensis TaxID=2572576 RepID=A0A4U1L1V2_9SPHN|nr:hypothetical protein [Sphingomonas baiyangensis]TKD50562.1 hypothetical protein FBR43_07135 [Sphingomonas baiyangensis]
MTAGAKNMFGVYTPHEVLTLERDRKGWRGLPVASIELLHDSSGWRSAINYQFMHGDCAGHGEPLTDRSPHYPSRDAAIAGAAERLRPAAARRDDGDARKVLAWLDELQPAQADLFASLI